MSTRQVGCIGQTSQSCLQSKVLVQGFAEVLQHGMCLSCSRSPALACMQAILKCYLFVPASLSISASALNSGKSCILWGWRSSWTGAQAYAQLANMKTSDLSLIEIADSHACICTLAVVKIICPPEKSCPPSWPTSCKPGCNEEYRASTCRECAQIHSLLRLDPSSQQF